MCKKDTVSLDITLRGMSTYRLYYAETGRVIYKYRKCLYEALRMGKTNSPSEHAILALPFSMKSTVSWQEMVWLVRVSMAEN